MRFGLLAVGLLLVAMGGLWALQGLGIIMWPSSSFMLQDMTWAYIGGATALAGLGLVVLSRRR